MKIRSRDQNAASKAPQFSTLWHKIVDMDETDVEIRYKSTIVKEDQVFELPMKRDERFRMSAVVNPPKYKTIDYEIIEEN